SAKRKSDLGREPALEAMTRRVPAGDFVDPSPRDGEVPVLTVLHAPEVLAHVLCLPRRIARELGEVVPIPIVRIHQDHGIVRGAPAECSRTGVEDPGLTVDRAVPWVPPLLRRIGIVTDPEVPSDRVTLCRDAVEDRDVIVRGQAVPLFVPTDAAGKLLRVTARL